jgi:hypothetical protein
MPSTHSPLSWLYTAHKQSAANCMSLHSTTCSLQFCTPLAIEANNPTILCTGATSPASGLTNEGASYNGIASLLKLVSAAFA